MRKGTYGELPRWVAYALQWGRNLIVAEGKTTTVLIEPTVALQWGRNLIVAEGMC